MKKFFLVGIFLLGAWIITFFFLVLIPPSYLAFQKDKNVIKDHKDEGKVVEQFYAEVEQTAREGVNIQEVPRLDLNEDKLMLDEYQRVLYYDGYKNRKVIFNNAWIDYLRFSSSKEKLGFFYEHYDYPIAGRDVSLAILDVKSLAIKVVYTGSYHTSQWEWNDEDHVTVYYSCGTCCMYVHYINVVTGKEERAHHDEPYEQECIAPALKN
jgi:hypothetical protein